MNVAQHILQVNSLVKLVKFRSYATLGRTIVFSMQSYLV
jgi:hypothetical protein